MDLRAAILSSGTEITPCSNHLACLDGTHEHLTCRKRGHTMLHLTVEEAEEQ